MTVKTIQFRVAGLNFFNKYDKFLTYNICEVSKLSISTGKLTRISIFLALALALQFAHLPQLATGPAINAVLLISACHVGYWAIMIGVLTPLIALLAGILPSILTPFVPVIMFANVSFIVVFLLFARLTVLLRVALAAVIKYMVFFVALHYIFVLLDIALPEPLLAAFGLVQLFTALLGGVVAVVVCRYLIVPANN